MAEQFLGEIRAFAFGFAPRGWAACDGQVLPIASNQALYSLLGTTYGGDGRTTFALPDLRGRVPIDAGPTHAQGSSGGAESVTLTTAQLPAHSHAWSATSATADQAMPTDMLHAASTATNPQWATPGTAVAMAPEVVVANGGNQGHQNMQPYLVVQLCIALEGIYPSRD